MKLKVLVIIPCYNVEKTIINALGNISNNISKNITEILAINNQSTDKTLQILKKIKLSNEKYKENLKILNNDNNYGLGGSLKIGFMYALEKKFDYLIIIHSDEQGNTNKILNNFFKNIFKYKDIDFFMASRFIKGSQIMGYSKVRILGNYFFNFMTFILTKVKLSDSGCGIVAIKTRLLKKVNFISLSDNFYFNPQLNIYLGRATGIRRMDIPLEWKDAEIPSNLKILTYIHGLLKFLLTFFIKGPNRVKFNKQVIMEFKKKYTFNLFE